MAQWDQYLMNNETLTKQENEREEINIENQLEVSHDLIISIF